MKNVRLIVTAATLAMVIALMALVWVVATDRGGPPAAPVSKGDGPVASRNPSESAAKASMPETASAPFSRRPAEQPRLDLPPEHVVSPLNAPEEVNAEGQPVDTVTYLEKAGQEAAQVKARQAQRMTQKLRRAGNLGRALCEYSAKHQGLWSETLDQLVDAGMLRQEDLVNPDCPNLVPGYVYLPPPVEAAPDAVVLYEAYDGWPPDGVAALYVDGHMRIFQAEAELMAALAGEDAP